MKETSHEIHVPLRPRRPAGARRGPAATVLFDENFAEEALTIPAVGGQANNAVGLDSFTFDSGSVDLFTDGGFGLPCPSAGCLDLDGSTGDAAHLRSIPLFSLQGGVTYQLTANVRGNARGGDSDLIVLGMSGGAFFQGSENFTLAPDDDWRVLEVLLQPIVDADARIIIFHTGGDNVGILLDRVTLIEGYEPPAPAPIPLPPAVGLMFFAMSALGVAGRRRATPR